MARNMRDIVFGTMNLYNLQLPGAAMYATSRPYTQQEYDEKVAWTAGMLRQLDADVIAFQELWSPQCLTDLFTAAGLIEDYQFAFILQGGWDGIAVAGAVRRPWVLQAAKRHKAFPEGFVLRKRRQSMREINANPTAVDLLEDEDLLPSHEDDEIAVAIREFSRSALQLSVSHERAPEVPTIEVICTHLKSKLPTRLDMDEFRNDAVRPHAMALGAAISTIRRTAEATALRIILNDLMGENDTPVVVLGDLNDGLLSNTLGILSAQPSYRVYTDSIAARRNDKGLFSAATMQQLRSLSDYLYTHEFKNVREIIDHVMVSEQFYDHSESRKWSFREMRIWNDYTDNHDGRVESDHGFVRASFDWLPAPGN